MTKQVHIHIYRTKAADAFEESKHPRAANGQFGSGGGGGAKKAKAPAGPSPSKGQVEGGTREQDRTHFLNVVRDPKNATTEQLREAVDYWHEVGTAAGHGGQEHAASQQRMRMAVNELQARGEKVPGFEKPKVAPTSQNQKIAAEMKKADGSEPEDWGSFNGNWEAAKNGGKSVVEKVLSAAKTPGDRTDAMLALKNKAAEAHRKGSYLGAVVVGLVNDYFERLR